MSKRLILLSERGEFMEWASGCVMCTRTTSSGRHAVTVSGFSGTMINLSLHSEDVAFTVLALWLRAILTASDGGLLRWDDERQQVMDDLAGEA